MARISLRTSLAALFLFSCGSLNAQQSPAPKPLRDCELLALAGGNALPENIVDRINAGGIDFRPNSEYREQLRNAGATDTVIAAMQRAKLVEEGARPASTADLLQHLSIASGLANQKKYDEAIEELNVALAAGYKGPEVGYVLARILVEEEEYEGALTVYDQILKRDASFPEVHTKMSFVYHRGGDDDEALNQAKIALAATPNNAEAHKFAGIALNAMQKYADARTEYTEALRLKPSYQSVHLDLGILYDNIRDTTDSIAEYQKAIELDPNDVDAHYSLAIALDTTGNSDGAVREYRAAKQIDPSRLDVRQNLASSLMEKDLPGAISEMHEMEEMYPETVVCHDCLGSALFRSGDLQGASDEYKIASKLDPSDSMIHVRMGMIAEAKQDFDIALNEYHRAEELNNANNVAYASAGELLLYRKHDVNGAMEELKQAEALTPGDAKIHQLYAEAVALQKSGRVVNENQDPNR